MKFKYILLSMNLSGCRLAGKVVNVYERDNLTVIDFRTQGKTALIGLKPCNGCFWNGIKSMDIVIGQNAKEKKDIIIQDAKKENRSFMRHFRIESGFKVEPYWLGSIFNSGMHSCKKDIMCEFKIMWDGQFDFTEIFIQKVENDKLIDGAFFEWQLENPFNKLFIVTHRFSGDIKRRIFFNPVCTKSEGTITTTWYNIGIGNHANTRIVNNGNGLDLIKIHPYQDNPEIDFIAGLFGFVDH